MNFTDRVEAARSFTDLKIGLLMVLNLVGMSNVKVLPFINSEGQMPSSLKVLVTKLMGQNFGRNAFGTPSLRYEIKNHPDQVDLVFGNYRVSITAHVGPTGNVLNHIRVVGDFENGDADNFVNIAKQNNWDVVRLEMNVHYDDERMHW